MLYSPSDHVERNREAWNKLASDYVASGHRHWGDNRITWGIWGVPEENLHILPDVRGLDTIELGCGTAYVSSWLVRRGARAIGIDNSPEQLKSAHSFQREFRVEFPLILGNAEEVPLPDESFDFAISEYGASIWYDPYKWIAEASRLLRPEGRLVFLVNGTILMLCVPDENGVLADRRLRRDYFGMHRLEWPDDVSVEFHLPYGEWIPLLKTNGFVVDDLIEIQAPKGATTTYEFIDNDWARRWPSEEVWVVHKTSDGR